MVLDLSLYAQYTGIVGFRLIFLIVAIIETIELASLAVRTLIRKMEYVGA
jgi:ABC-type thiamin/hydroxymethylpyrimidine transport system permease subunit